MTDEDFQRIAGEEWDRVPAHFARLVENVALLVEDEPSDDVRREEGLGEGETLLGLYHGIPNTARGDLYGVGPTLPDTVTLYRVPILEEAGALWHGRGKRLGDFGDAVREVVRETIWHEIGHYFGLDDPSLHEREDDGTNAFGA